MISPQNVGKTNHFMGTSLGSHNGDIAQNGVYNQQYDMALPKNEGLPGFFLFFEFV